MKRFFAVLVCLMLFLSLSAGLAEGKQFEYRFADATEAAKLLLSNREYYDNLTQNDLNYRLQKLDATLEELESFTATQMLDFTAEEKKALDNVMAYIEQTCEDRKYALPQINGIVFVKTTMDEECGAGAYTHGTQIYLGSLLMEYGLSDKSEDTALFYEIVAHELFHCLTRNAPDFRTEMYGILGFTVEDEDYIFGQAVRERMISNPDVEHHNSHAAFEINGEMRDCAVILMAAEPFREPGDSFFSCMQTGLVPIDDLNTVYLSDEASNFWEVFGRNTDYVIDPEEALADNFRLLIIYGTDGIEYSSPEIIRAMEEILTRDVQSEVAEAA